MSRRDIFLTAVAIVAIGAFIVPARAWHVADADDDTLSTGRIMSAGRVVKVDAAAGQVTVEHRPIWRFYMEFMVMIFRVEDPTMLVGVRPGDKIRFDVERRNKEFVITRIENSN